MPFTYLAHQAPVLPVATRWPRLDGLALVVGSLAPDLWYVTQGWGWGPVGIPLWQDGHDWRTALTHWGLLSLVLCLALRRWVFPVVPRALPDCGEFHLRDLTVLERSRSRWWITIASGMVGGATHVFIDGFTHVDGWAVEAFAPLRASVVRIGSRELTVAKALQYGGTVIGALIAIELLRRMGRRRELLERRGIDPISFRSNGAPPLGLRERIALSIGMSAGVIGGVGYALTRLHVRALGADVSVEAGASIPIMAFSWVFAAGVLVGSIAARFAGRTVAPARGSPFGTGSIG